ncbi:carbon monoxide dehydrogenase subunit G [Dongia sp.]|uniref:SRPBCC family protein n=1 Tax=Dongia sp. TaxID=1977262 RepID=UPI0035AEA1AB
MDMSGEYTIKAPREAVWAALNDPEMLKGAIAGCEELVKDGDGFKATVVAKVGPVKAKFGGRVTLSDLDPPKGYTISGEGQGGAAGFAKGGAKVQLEEAPGGGTILKYTASAQIGGKLAQIGSRLIDGTAKKMADDFFSAFAASVESKAGGLPTGETLAPDASADGGAASVAETPPENAAAAQKGLHPAIWIGGLVVVVGAILYAFTRN